MVKRFILFALILMISVGVVSATEIFSNGFNSLADIGSDGGSVEGSASFVSGVQGNAVYLADFSAIRFSGMDFPNIGAISFWVNPDYDIKSMPRWSTVGLFEVGNYPGADSFGVFVYKSEYGPVVPFEVKDSFGNFRQVWSKVNSFKQAKWHNVIIVWEVNNPKHSKNSATVYVDGVKYKTQKDLGNVINLNNKQMRIGTTGYYDGMPAAFDNLKVFSSNDKNALSSVTKEALADYKATKQLI